MPVELDRVYWFFEGDPGVSDIRGPFSNLLHEEQLPRLLRDYETWCLDMRLCELREGKMAGSSRAQTGARDNVFLSRLQSSPNYLKNLRTQATQAKKEFDRLVGEAKRELFLSVSMWREGKLSFADLQRDTANFFEGFYERVWLSGRKASGLDLYVPEGKPTKRETEWLRSAIREELTYWQSFLKEVKRGIAPFDDQLTPDQAGLQPPRRKWTVEERIGVYLKGLEGVFENGRVSGMPSNLLFYWHGPKPGDRGICLTDASCQVATLCGRIQLKDIVVGDLVLTHRGRWKRVTAKHINSATIKHKYAVVVGSDFQLFGITQDHRVWTNAGWITAEEAVRTQEDVLNVEMGIFQTESERRTLHRNVLGRNENAADIPCPMGVGEHTWPYTKRVRRSPQKWNCVGRPFNKFEVTNDIRTPQITCKDSTQKGSKEKTLASVQELRQEVSNCAQSDQKTKLFPCVSACMAKPTRNSSYLCGVRKETKQKSGICSKKELLLSEVLSKRASSEQNQDPAVCLLREEFRTKNISNQVVREGQIILLSGVLPEGSPLFDISVEEDHSFVVEGLAVHNCLGCEYIVERQPYTKSTLPAVPNSGATNCSLAGRCRHKLVVRRAKLEEVAQRNKVLPKRETMVKQLRSIMRGGPRYKVKGKLVNPWKI